VRVLEQRLPPSVEDSEEAEFCVYEGVAEAIMIATTAPDRCEVRSG
jgi:hypothetical protein